MEHEDDGPMLCALCMTPLHGPRRFHDIQSGEKLWAHPACQQDWEET